jgi:glycine/D-amino acid oxidase-like deaminating enzyme
MIDYLIVGQGLAGSLLGWHLLKQEKNILIIDEASGNSSSLVASGIINPITGKRFSKSWQVDEFMAEAISTYQEIEAQFGISCLKHQPIFHVLNSVEEVNEWSLKSATLGYEQYLSSTEIARYDEQKLANPFGGFHVNKSYRIESSTLLGAMTNYFEGKGILVKGVFEEAALEIKESHIIYKDIEAKEIIFCNGVNAQGMELFKHVPFQPAKGECLLVEIQDFYADEVIHGAAVISPTVDKDIYYVGSSYQWKYEDDKPTEAIGAELKEKLEKTIRCGYKQVGRKAAIRPAVKDRRPYLGRHYKYGNVLLFNGLGTKGFSMGPYFAKHFCEYLLHRKPLPVEVDMNRFLSNAVH